MIFIYKISQIQIFNTNPLILSKKIMYKKLINLLMKQPITIINKAVTTNIKHKFNPSRREYLFTTKIAKNPEESQKKFL